MPKIPNESRKKIPGEISTVLWLIGTSQQYTEH